MVEHSCDPSIWKVLVGRVRSSRSSLVTKGVWNQLCEVLSQGFKKRFAKKDSLPIKPEAEMIMDKDGGH